MSTNKCYWKITVSNWGTLYGYGTEAEAEDWRYHKAQWEHETARKERISKSDIPEGEQTRVLADLIG